MQEGYITPKEEKYPEAEAILWEDPSTSGNFWLVERCPYCGKRHRHEAGKRGEDPRSRLGHQRSHCDKKYPTDRGYVLIEKLSRIGMEQGHHRPPRTYQKL